jgi:xanthine dehydrogenase molybdopterin-binding subunit B
MDPMEVRRANITRAGDLLHHGSSTVPDDNILRCFEECLVMSNYAEERKAIMAFNADPRNAHVRRGIAILPTKFAPCVPFPLFNQGSAFVRIYKDGTVLLSHGGIEMGQGLHTKMLQVGLHTRTFFPQQEEIFRAESGVLVFLKKHGIFFWKGEIFAKNKFKKISV